MELELDDVAVCPHAVELAVAPLLEAVDVVHPLLAEPAAADDPPPYPPPHPPPPLHQPRGPPMGPQPGRQPQPPPPGAKRPKVSSLRAEEKEEERVGG